MKYVFSKIKELFKDTNIDVKESLSTVISSFSISRNQLPDIKELFTAFSGIPARDYFEFNLEVHNEEIITIRNENTDEGSVTQFIDSLYPDDEISITIQIDKTVSENVFSIYDYASFTNDLISRSIIEILQWFSMIMKSSAFMRFEVFDCDVSFSTKTIAFSSDITAEFPLFFDRNERLESCKETSFFYNMDKYELLPDDFIIQGINKAGGELIPLFGKIATVLSLLYVVSSSTINSEGIDLQISGQRTVHNSLNFENIDKNRKWISMYNWIYDGGNSTDKMLIANNVMSLYCKYDNFLNPDSVMFDAIKTNYRLYLRNNVSQYLDMKRDISKFIQEVISQVGNYALSVFSKFKSNLIAMAGFLFTVVLVQIGSERGFEDVFTKDAIRLFEAFLLGSVIYLATCLYESLFQVSMAERGYKELKDNYRDVLSQIELKEAFKNDELFSEYKKTARKGIFKWSAIWLFLLVTGVIIIEFLTPDHGLAFWLVNKIKEMKH